MDSSESAITAHRRSDVWWLFGVLLALLLLYAPTILSFYNVFSEEGADESHAPLLLLVTLYLLYRAWSQSGRPIRLAFNRLAVLALAGFSILWMVLGLVFVEAGQQAILILILASATLGLLGIREGARYLVPIMLLLSVVPVWGLFTPYLQTASTVASAYVLDLVGITSIREGYLLIIPNGTFEVAGACAGLRFQLVGITLALIHTQLVKVPVRGVLLYVLTASLLAFLANVVRIFIVVVIGYFYGMDNEYVQDHDFIGWTLFAIIFLSFMFFGEKRLKAHEIAPAGSDLTLQHETGHLQKFSGVLLVVAGLSVGPVLYGFFTHQEAGVTRTEPLVPKPLVGWRQVSDQLADWTPIWTLGDRTVKGRFDAADGRVDLFATEFSRQRQGHEAVNVSHRVYDIEKWSRISRSARVVKVPGAGEVAVEETLLKSPDRRRRLVWLWYRTNGKIVATNVQAKINNLLGIFSGNPEITVFVLSKEIIKDEVRAAGVLESFLETYLTQVGENP